MTMCGNGVNTLTYVFGERTGGFLSPCPAAAACLDICISRNPDVGRRRVKKNAGEGEHATSLALITIAAAIAK